MGRFRGPTGTARGRPSRRAREIFTLSPALVGLPGAAGAARREGGRAAERRRVRAVASGGEEEEAAVVVGALVGVGERGVGGVDADEVLRGGGGGRVRGGVRVDGERQPAVRGLDLARAGARAEAEDVVEGGAGGRRVVRRGDGRGGGEGRGEGRRHVGARGGRRGRGRGARPEGEEAGRQRGARGDHAGAGGGSLQEKDFERRVGIWIAAGSSPSSPFIWLAARVAFGVGLAPAGQRFLWAACIGRCAS